MFEGERMKRKVRVWFKIEPILKYITQEEYPNLDIYPEFNEEDQLIGFYIDIEVNQQDSNDIIQEIAKNKITPLIERFRYMTKMQLEIKTQRIQQVDPYEQRSQGSISMKCNACLYKPCQMPNENDFIKIEEIKQRMWQKK